MNVRMICPKETIENAKKAREKLLYLLSECRKYGRKESRWMIAEITVRFFVSFGAGYCTFCAFILSGSNIATALLFAVFAVIAGAIISLRLPLLSDTQNIMLNSWLLGQFRLLNAIIMTMDTLSSVMKESPSLIISEEGDRAEILKNEYGDIAVLTMDHRYVFPRGLEYTAFQDNPAGLSTMDFHVIDILIEEIRKLPLIIAE